MTREPHWDYMSRRLREEDMKESLHSVLSESQKMELNKIFDDANDSNLLKHQTQELQGQLQAAYKRIKILNDSVTEQRDKIFRLEKLVPTKQLEFKF
jgi:hypothetical protein